MNSRCGIDPFASSPIPLMKRWSAPPSTAFPVPKANEYPTSTHGTPTTPKEATDIIVVLSMLFDRTTPAWKRPSAGVMRRTRPVARAIQSVSIGLEPVSGTGEEVWRFLIMQSGWVNIPVGRSGR